MAAGMEILALQGGEDVNYSQMNTYQAWQDKQDFNNYLSRMNSYGSAYAAGCRPGNPYC